ncbi:MAG: DUF4292 domain-containing protein [Muribaculaceae bacterium]|nr:DUF4292 domain-containing protein [Muribaculaceae bacterium]MDE6772245.1 DUF4292 domain-containing protein [Muribaculaceae bacterium]
MDNLLLKGARHILMLVSLLASFVSAFAQTPLDDERKEAVVDSITRGEIEWESLTLAGKFKMNGLPVSPSVRIYMKRDSVILMSLRAPFVGEVGRAEIADSMILVVNKMNKTYVEEPIEKALAYYPGGISDIQNLLLGQAFIPGHGVISPDMKDMLELYEEEDGSVTVITTEDYRLDGFNYGYSFSPEWALSALMVLPLDKPDVAVTLQYLYYPKGYDIEFHYQSEKRDYRATLELDNPDIEGKGFKRIKIDGKYTQLPFDKFISGFKN